MVSLVSRDKARESGRQRRFPCWCTQTFNRVRSKPRHKVEALCKSWWAPMEGGNAGKGERNLRKRALFMARRIQSNESNLALTCHRWQGIESHTVAVSYRVMVPTLPCFLPTAVISTEDLVCPWLSHSLLCPSARSEIRWPA